MRSPQPCPLSLGERHDRSQRLEESGEEHVGDVGVDDPAEKLDAVLGGRDEVLLEEREGDLVARAVHHHVGLHRAAVREPDPSRGERLDVRLRGDGAVLDAVEDAPGDGRVGLAEAMVRLRQPVPLGWAGVAEQEPLGDPLTKLERQAGVVAELVDGFAEYVLRHDPHALARRQVGALGDVGGLDRDVHRRVPHPEHHHAAAREDRVLDVGVGVELQSLELLAAGERGFWPARVPVVAVGDDQHVVFPGLAPLELDRPHALLIARGLLDAGLEGDPVAEAEVVHVGVEVGGDLGVMGEVRVGLGHRVVRVGHPRARGVDEQVPVGRRHPVPVFEHPVPAHAVGLLEAVEGDPPLVQRLRHRDSG